MSKSDGTLITSSCNRCLRCKGLLVSDIFLCDSTNWLRGLRCVNCGWVKIQEEEVKVYANKEKDRGTNKTDELELYKIRSRGEVRTFT